MIQRYCEGRIPSGAISDESRLAAKRAGVEDESAISDFVSHARDEFLHYFEEFAFSRALEEAWGIVARIDKMISEAKPWDLAKDTKQTETLNAVLYRAAESLRWLSVLLYPVVPNATIEIYKQLGLPGDAAITRPSDLKWGGLVEGTETKEIKPLFPRIDKAKTMEEIKSQESGVRSQESDEQRSEVRDQRPEDRDSSQTVREAVAPSQGSGQHATEADAVPGVAYIDITDFAKTDLRVGEVKTAERIPKADKLLLITVDIGEEKPRQILAGIAQHYEPEKLIGRKIVVVANLKPRKLRGYESQGMLLAASVGDEGKPVIATFAEDVPNGARLK
jgi:methionyl-tRNA synthetase